MFNQIMHQLQNFIRSVIKLEEVVKKKLFVTFFLIGCKHAESNQTGDRGTTKIQLQDTRHSVWDNV
jgi:hypothetical protein